MNNTKNSIRPVGWVTKRNGRQWAIISIAVAAVLIIAVIFAAKGCSQNGQVLPETTETPSASVPADPVEGGTLSIPMPKNPGTLNPLQANTAEMVSIGWLIYESLIKYDEKGRVVNGVAESFETADNGKTWTFHIKKGIKFHRGGGDLTANDVLYTYNLIMSYSSGECLYKDSAAARIENMEAEDEYTLTVTAAKSGHTVMDALCFPILSKSYYSSRNPDTALPEGTGPYVVRESAASGMLLKANEDWWKQRPHIETIHAVAVPDNDAALSSFEANELTIVPTQQITAGRYKQNTDTVVYDVATQRYECLVTNLQDSVLTSLSVRQAIAYSLDTKTMIGRAFLGRAVTIDTPVTPDNYLFDAGAETYEYNLKKAGELLDALGWVLPEDAAQRIRINAQGQPLDLHLLIDENPDSTVRKDMALAIKDQLRKAGINVVIDTKSWDDYLSALRNKSFDLALCGFNLDRSLDLTRLLHSSGSINYAGYSDGGMDALLDAYEKSTEESDRKKNMSKIQRSILEKLPVISLCFRTYSLVSDAAVCNVEGVYNMNYYNNIERWFIKSGV